MRTNASSKVSNWRIKTLHPRLRLLKLKPFFPLLRSRLPLFGRQFSFSFSFVSKAKKSMLGLNLKRGFRERRIPASLLEKGSV
jgi:hypothetical protein